MSFSETFIRRPIATTLLTLGLAMAGGVAYFLLPVEPLPNIDVPTISVSASLPGASPEMLTLLSLGMLPFFLFLTYRVGKIRRGISTETQKSLADLSVITEETLSVSGMLLSKTFGRQGTNIDRFRAPPTQSSRCSRSARAWSDAGSS